MLLPWQYSPTQVPLCVALAVVPVSASPPLYVRFVGLPSGCTLVSKRMFTFAGGTVASLQTPPST